MTPIIEKINKINKIISKILRRIVNVLLYKFLIWFCFILLSKTPGSQRLGLAEFMFASCFHVK